MSRSKHTGNAGRYFSVLNWASEKWGLEVQLAQSQMQILEKAVLLARWEAAQISKRLEAAVKARDEAIRAAAERSKVDLKDGYRPDVGNGTWRKER